MTENDQWKDRGMSDSDAHRSLEEIAFILSAGIFGAVFVYGALQIWPACCFFGTLPAFLFGAVGGAAGAAIGAAREGPFGGAYSALLGTVLGLVAASIIEMVLVPIIENAVPWVLFIVFLGYGFVFGFPP